MNNTYMINGYKVVYCYAGIDQYTVYKDGKEIGTCWDIGKVGEWVKMDAEAVKEYMWEHRWD